MSMDSSHEWESVNERLKSEILFNNKLMILLDKYRNVLNDHKCFNESNVINDNESERQTFVFLECEYQSIVNERNAIIHNDDYSNDGNCKSNGNHMIFNIKEENYAIEIRKKFNKLIYSDDDCVRQSLTVKPQNRKTPEHINKRKNKMNKNVKNSNDKFNINIKTEINEKSENKCQNVFNKNEENHHKTDNKFIVTYNGITIDFTKYKRIDRFYHCEWPQCVFKHKTFFHFKRHILNHYGIKPFQCDYPECKSAFTMEYKLKQHIHDVHLSAPNSYECTEENCGKKLKTLGSLRTHMLMHSNVWYFCTNQECDYKTKNPNDSRLKWHLKSHKGNDITKPFKCDWEGCDKSFIQNSELKYHLRSHTNERPFTCSWPGCEKSFKYSHELKYHSNSHTNKNVCLWPGCESTFACNSGLKKHMLSHGEMNVACDWPGCEYRTYTVQRLNFHMRVKHKGERKHCCTWKGCQLKFATKDKLIVHIRSHTKEKPFKCEWPGCEWRSSTKGNRRLHMKNIHFKKVND